MLLSKVVFLFFLAILVLLFLSFSPPPPPPPSFHPLLCSPCGSSIYQPVWFSLYLALGGSAAYIKYSKEDRLVQQPSNLCTKRERETEARCSPSLCHPGDGSLRKSPKGRRTPFSLWLSLSACRGSSLGEQCGLNVKKLQKLICGAQRKTEKTTAGGGGVMWCKCGRKCSNWV